MSYHESQLYIIHSVVHTPERVSHGHIFLINSVGLVVVDAAAADCDHLSSLVRYTEPDCAICQLILAHEVSIQPSKCGLRGRYIILLCARRHMSGSELRAWGEAFNVFYVYYITDRFFTQMSIYILHKEPLIESFCRCLVVMIFPRGYFYCRDTYYRRSRRVLHIKR